MGSACLPRVMYRAADTERYVWSSKKRLANERLCVLLNEDTSCRTIFGRKTAEVTRCALLSREGTDLSVSVPAWLGPGTKNVQEKVGVYPASTVATRCPAADTVPNHVPPHDFLHHASQPRICACATAHSYPRQPLLLPLLNEIVDRAASTLHHGCVMEQRGAQELDGERRVVADASVECKCGPLLWNGRRFGACDLKAMHDICVGSYHF
jgi:hypothetical protein